jgi:hypothetical protein
MTGRAADFEERRSQSERVYEQGAAVRARPKLSSPAVITQTAATQLLEHLFSSSPYALTRGPLPVRKKSSTTSDNTGDLRGSHTPEVSDFPRSPVLTSHIRPAPEDFPDVTSGRPCPDVRGLNDCGLRIPQKRQNGCHQTRHP